ncbi:hypothetical protein [Helicobacter burdigaliensis]
MFGLSRWLRIPIQSKLFAMIYLCKSRSDRDYFYNDREEFLQNME